MTKETSHTSLRKEKLHLYTGNRRSTRMPLQMKYEHSRCPHREVEYPKHPQKGKKHLKTAIYEQHDQSYQFTSDPDQTPNNAIFPIFQHTSHEFRGMDRTNCYTTTIYNQSYQLMKSSDHTSNNAIFPAFKHTNHEIWATDPYQSGNPQQFTTILTSHTSF